jgi:hypothetical protein
VGGSPRGALPTQPPPPPVLHDTASAAGAGVALGTQIVLDAIQRKAVPLDPNGIYFVLTSGDVSTKSGFCEKYCGKQGWARERVAPLAVCACVRACVCVVCAHVPRAYMCDCMPLPHPTPPHPTPPHPTPCPPAAWHSYHPMVNMTLKYSFVGEPLRCLKGCGLQGDRGPNGNAAADAMATGLAHQVSGWWWEGEDVVVQGLLAQGQVHGATATVLTLILAPCGLLLPVSPNCQLNEAVTDPELSGWCVSETPGSPCLPLLYPFCCQLLQTCYAVP